MNATVILTKRFVTGLMKELVIEDPHTVHSSSELEAWAGLIGREIKGLGGSSYVLDAITIKEDYGMPIDIERVVYMIEARRAAAVQFNQDDRTRPGFAGDLDQWLLENYPLICAIVMPDGRYTLYWRNR